MGGENNTPAPTSLNTGSDKSGIAEVPPELGVLTTNSYFAVQNGAYFVFNVSLPPLVGFDCSMETSWYSAWWWCYCSNLLLGDLVLALLLQYPVQARRCLSTRTVITALLPRLTSCSSLLCLIAALSKCYFTALASGTLLLHLSWYYYVSLLPLFLWLPCYHFITVLYGILVLSYTQSTLIHLL